MRQGLIGGVVGLVLGAGAVLAVGFITDDDAPAPEVCDRMTTFTEEWATREFEGKYDKPVLDKLNLVLTIHAKAC